MPVLSRGGVLPDAGDRIAGTRKMASPGKRTVAQTDPPVGVDRVPAGRAASWRLRVGETGTLAGRHAYGDVHESGAASADVAG